MHGWIRVKIWPFVVIGNCWVPSPLSSCRRHPPSCSWACHPPPHLLYITQVEWPCCRRFGWSSTSGVHDDSTTAINPWTVPKLHRVIHPRFRMVMVWFLRLAVLLGEKKVARKALVNPCHIQIESGGNEWRQDRALSLSEKGKRHREIAPVETPRSILMCHTIGLAMLDEMP